MKVMRILAPIRLLQNYEKLELQRIYIEKSFGRTKNYLVFDTLTEEHQIIPNHNPHCGKNNPLIVVTQTKPDIVLVANLGYQPYHGISALGVQIKQARTDIPIGLQFKFIQQLENFPIPLFGTTCTYSRK
jgi:predicted Fe-Mo cluster-binding NifX family protein